MQEQYTEGEDFNGINFLEEGLSKGEYEKCTFNNCVFTGADLSSISFIDCEFVHCDLSMAKVVETAFREVKFTTCKMLGLHFDNCNAFLLSVNFEGCQLNLSSFYQLSLKNSLFKNCTLHEVDFSEADLTSATLYNCDLAGAIFDQTSLEKADLRYSYNFSIDPEKNRIRKAKFSQEYVAGLLYKHDISVE
jgi:fluoroquinolone resistance protein